MPRKEIRRKEQVSEKSEEIRDESTYTHRIWRRNEEKKKEEQMIETGSGPSTQLPWTIQSPPATHMNHMVSLFIYPHSPYRENRIIIWKSIARQNIFIQMHVIFKLRRINLLHHMLDFTDSIVSTFG